MKKIKLIFLIALTLCILTSFASGQQNKAEQLYQQALYEMEGKGNYSKAIESFNLVLTKFPKEKITAAKALLNIGRCYEKLGKSEAIKAYERILKEFKDQKQIVTEARTRLAALKQSANDGVSQSIATNRQIWAGKDIDTEGAPSPDGQYLSYSDKGRLAIYNVKSGERIILGNPSFDKHMYVNESVWSPDSKQLAYGLIDEDHGIAEIQLVDIAGRVHRKLCHADSVYTYIWIEDWSKDGKMILAVFQNSDGSDSRIALVSVADGSVQFVKNMKFWDWRISRKLFFSPDGRFIAYSSPTERKSKSCDIFVFGIDGTNEINITQHLDDDQVLGWDQYGSRLLFANNRSGSYNLWTIKIVNGQPQEYPKQIRNNIGKISSMGLTKEGSLYYSVTSSEVTGFSSHESNIYLASLDPKTGKIESPAQPLTMQNNGFNHSLTWSPDGKKLLFYSVFWENSSKYWNKTFIFSPETGLEKNVVSQITADTVTAYNWFPDGKHLAVMARLKDGSSGGIYNFEIKTGKMVPLLISNKDTAYAFPSVSPDGKTIFTHTFVPNNQSIYSYDTEKKERKLLFQSGKDRYIYSVRLSSDGKQLAFILMTIRPGEFPALMVMPSSGGEARAIFRPTTSGLWGLFAWYYGLDWSPDGKHIYFAKRPDEVSPFKLLRVPVQGGTPEQTGVEMEGLHSISIRPDGKQIAFSAGTDPKKEIWVLENIFAEDPTEPTKLSGLATRRILEDASKIGETLTAEGKYIRSLDENTGDILQFEIASGDTTRIKNKSKWDEKEKSFQDIVFSHDGKQIVYNIEVFDPETKSWGYPLQIRNLDGSNLRTLYCEKGSYYLRPLDWSPDGSSVLVFLSHKNKIELALISIEDSSLHIIKNISPGWQQFQAARFSPDGKFIAMNKMLGGSTPNSDILLITADGQNEFVIAEHFAEDQLIGWTPDGLSLIFFSDRTGTWDIWMAHIANGKQLGEPELLKKDFGWDTEVLGFAPDGSLFYKTPNSMGRLFTGSIDIETGKLLTPPSPVKTRYTSSPVQTIWSPDGKNLAYISRWNFMHPDNSRLTIRSEATGKEKFLTPRLRFVNQISWASDGKSIIALGLEETSQGIYQIDVETSEIKKLIDEGVAPRLCPDGKNLLFVKGGPIIMKRNLETGETSEVVKIKGMNYDLSPDGREIVFQVDSLVKIISINGGESRELFRNSKVSPKWTKDGRFIIVGAKGSLWRIPVQGGTPLKLDLTFPKMQFLTLHPDNKGFAFSVNEESKSELWELKNFLPKEKK
jgi:Tol biopolymer transport system component